MIGNCRLGPQSVQNVNELVHIDEIQSGISPNLLVRNWPPAFQEWNTKAVRDAFYASPLLPRLLNPEAVKETIARGVSNGQLAYVGKTSGGKYHPFIFQRTVSAADVEISEEMFIITKEAADAYRQAPPSQEGPQAAATVTQSGGNTQLLLCKRSPSYLRRLDKLGGTEYRQRVHQIQ